MGEKQYGRNKVKCQKYRSKQKGSKAMDNKKPRGIRRFSADRPPKPYMNDDAFTDPDRMKQFVPIRVHPHLSTELMERILRASRDTASNGKTDAGEVARKLKKHLQDRVCTVAPKHEKVR